MSLASQWLLLHALLIRESSIDSIWKLERWLQPELVLLNLGCRTQLKVASGYWCITEQEFVLLNTMANDEAYIRLSPLRPSNFDNRDLVKQWFGTRISQQMIDGYELSIFQTPHTQAKLKAGFRLRVGKRIVTEREFKHGRYHLVLTQPTSDIFFVAVDQQTYIIEIQKTARSKSR